MSRTPRSTSPYVTHLGGGEEGEQAVAQAKNEEDDFDMVGGGQGS